MLFNTRAVHFQTELQEALHRMGLSSSVLMDHRLVKTRGFHQEHCELNYWEYMYTTMD